MDFNFRPYRRRFDVSTQEINVLCTEIYLKKTVCVLRLKSNVSINKCFWQSFLKHVRSLAVVEFGSYSMLTTVPLTF